MMTIHRYYPETQDDLWGILKTHAGNAQRVAMQAGHFLLYYDSESSRLLPCLQEALTAPHLQEIRKSFSAFPLFTWRLGIELLSKLPAKQKHLMIVVNDWQYVPKNIDRAVFYENNKELPVSYQNELNPYSSEIQLFQPKQIKTGSTRPFFSEMNQRNQFRRRIEKLLRKDMLPALATVIQSPEGVVCSIPAEATHINREFYCTGKSPDCAAQIAQMLSQAQEATKYDCFINFYPSVCRTYVENGTKLASDLFNLSATVINVGMPSSGVESISGMLQHSEVSVHSQNPNV
jgi:hypothetical protein